MAVRHGKASQATQAGEFSALLHAERISRHFVHPHGKVAVGNVRILRHQELAETSAEAQKHSLVRRFDRVLPCREAVKIVLERWMLVVIHYGSFDLHRAVVDHLLCNVIFQQAFYQPAFRQEAEIPRVAAAFIVYQLEFPHELDMGRLFVSDS